MRTRLLGSDVWQMLDSFGRRGKKILAVAYVSDARGFRFSKGDEIITDASRKAIASGQTSARVLLDAGRNGVRVFSLDNLHAKIFLASRVVIVGSTNLSASSRKLNEAAIVTSAPLVIAGTRRYLQFLRKQAKYLSIEKLEHLTKIAVDRRTWHQVKSEPPKPSLLDAIRRNSRSLDDVAFSWYYEGAALPKKSVRQHAVRDGIPLPSDGRWDWYESEFSLKALGAVRKQFSSRPLLAWRGIPGHERNDPVRFRAHQTYAVKFIGACRVKDRLVQIFDTTPQRTPFNLQSKRRDLARILSAGLNADRGLRRKIGSDLTGTMSTWQVRQLYKLGQKGT